MKKQKAFLKKLSKTQLEHLKIENKFTKATSQKRSEPREYSTGGEQWIGNFSREKRKTGESGQQVPILFAPKTKEELEKENRERIGERKTEPWEVEKVICIRFEVWGERKKMLKKGQITDFKKESVSVFDKIFKENPSVNYFENFNVEGEKEAEMETENKAQEKKEKVELLDENHAKRWKEILEDPRLNLKANEERNQKGEFVQAKDEIKELTLWEKMFN